MVEENNKMKYKTNKNEKFTIQEQLIRGFGEEICRAIKYWRPIKEQRCLTCGKWVYNIFAHALKEHKL